MKKRTAKKLVLHHSAVEKECCFPFLYLQNEVKKRQFYQEEGLKGQKCFKMRVLGQVRDEGSCKLADDHLEHFITVASVKIGRLVGGQSVFPEGQQRPGANLVQRL